MPSITLEETQKTFYARRQYINNLCKHRVQEGLNTNKVLSPPTVGRSLYGDNPMRTVEWATRRVWIDYTNVYAYDATLSLASYSQLWGAVAVLLNTVDSPTTDGVPQSVRRHLFSSCPILESDMFEIWYKQSQLWSNARLTHKTHRQHLFVVPS